MLGHPEVSMGAGNSICWEGIPLGVTQLRGDNSAGSFVLNCSGCNLCQSDSTTNQMRF